MKAKASNSPKSRALTSNYHQFDQLDGSHPLINAAPESCVLYPVRQLKFGKVAYFNFDLAKEMGLIPVEHPNLMNRDLEKKILETFNLRIINEFDQENNILYPGSSVKPNKFMATRYLQLQHPDKKGLSSGDGRCIWNGVIENNGKVWDVSSRGTGVTCLAPGFVEAGRPLESGNREFGYGCGLAEIDELYAGALAAEIFHQSGIHTERVLTLIDIGKGVGIGVRAGLNFIRPAHLFLHLKQNNWETLKKITDYVIDRQYQNKTWDFSKRHPRKYDLLRKQLVSNFAKFTAQLEREYIFAWLDWDGDNVLIDAGIIDYGSIRQFGLRHDQYRYDDVTRFSTNLNQQKSKARLTIQVFLQLVDFVETRKKTPLARFKNDPYLKEFDQIFERELLFYFTQQIGFTETQAHLILQNDLDSLVNFYHQFLKLEKLKIKRKTRRVADGLNRPPLLNMRKWLLIVGELFVTEPDQHEKQHYSFSEILSSFAGNQDKQSFKKLNVELNTLKSLYLNLVRKWATTPDIRLAMSQRVQEKNRPDRITGNALIHITDQILTAKNKGVKNQIIQVAMEHLIASQSSMKNSDLPPPKTISIKDLNHLLTGFESAIIEHREDI